MGVKGPHKSSWLTEVRGSMETKDLTKVKGPQRFWVGINEVFPGKRFPLYLNNVSGVKLRIRVLQLNSGWNCELKNIPKCFCHIFYKTRPIPMKVGTCYS